MCRGDDTLSLWTSWNWSIRLDEWLDNIAISDLNIIRFRLRCSLTLYVVSSKAYSEKITLHGNAHDTRNSQSHFRNTIGLMTTVVCAPQPLSYAHDNRAELNCNVVTYCLARYFHWPLQTLSIPSVQSILPPPF